MSRQFWTPGPVTCPDGRSVHAGMIRELILGNAEAVLEESGYDVCTMFAAPQVPGASWYSGPHPVPIRLDRDGLWRSIAVTPCWAGGNAGPPYDELVAYLLESYRPPTATDPTIVWSWGGGAIPTWDSEELLTPPPLWSPDGRRLTGSEPSVGAHWAWALFSVNLAGGGGSGSRVCGFRVRELVREVLP